MLTQYRKDVLGEDPLIAKEFTNSLPINLSKPTSSTSRAGKTWEGAYFHMVPTVAALTILSKFQNDLRVTENKIVTFCHEQVGKVVYRQDAVAALALANSTNLLPGQNLEITAGVGGFSKAVNPVISIAGKTVTLGEDGAAHLKMTAEGIGTHSIPVVIRYTDQDGKVQTIEKKVEYSVGQSNAAVQLDKLNVLFIGVDNPVTVSGSGSADQLKVGISGGGGSIRGSGGGHFMARVSSETDNCVISVTTPDGKTTPVRFRVRSIPDPTPMIGTNKGGEIQASYFRSQPGVRAVLENFFYETQFNVISFRMTGDGDGFADIDEKMNTGATWNEARSIINKCRPGSFVTIEDIRAVGPDGRTRKLPPMLFNLK
jgi:gliding motility-associated protein GldM